MSDSDREDFWHKCACRLSDGLIAISQANESVPASVLRSVAYDAALNCIDGETVAYQIERRAALGTEGMSEAETLQGAIEALRSLIEFGRLGVVPDYHQLEKATRRMNDLVRLKAALLQ